MRHLTHAAFDFSLATGAFVSGINYAVGSRPRREYPNVGSGRYGGQVQLGFGHERDIAKHSVDVVDIGGEPDNDSVAVTELLVDRFDFLCSR